MELSFTPIAQGIEHWFPKGTVRNIFPLIFWVIFRQNLMIFWSNMDILHQKIIEFGQKLTEKQWEKYF